MEIRITGRHIEISDEIRSYLEKKINKLEKYFNRIVEIHAIIDKEKYRCSVEVALQTSTGNIVAQHENEDMYSTIDLVLDKLERQLKRLKEKRRDHKRNSKDNRYTDLSTDDAEDTVVPFKITDVQKLFMKVMPVEDAVIKLNEYDTTFFVFINSSTKEINLIYRRKDGNLSLVILQKDK